MVFDLDAMVKLFAIFGAIGGVWWRVNMRIAECEKAILKMENKIVKEYASSNSLKEVEKRLVNAIDRLTNRIDKLLDAAHGINNGSSKSP